MGQPAARMTDMTATADLIVGPSCPTVMVSFLPAAVVGDAVTGPVVAGAVTKGSLTVYFQNRPVARMGDTVSGVNAVTGAPITSAIATPCVPTVFIGG